MTKAERVAAHTPGPWRALALNWGLQIVPDSRAKKRRPVIGTVTGWTTDPRDDREAAANARLIAAAPELLEALKGILSSEYSTSQHIGAWRSQAEVERAHAAIDKAEGREP